MTDELTCSECGAIVSVTDGTLRFISPENIEDGAPMLDREDGRLFCLECWSRLIGVTFKAVTYGDKVKLGISTWIMPKEVS